MEPCPLLTAPCVHAQVRLGARTLSEGVLRLPAALWALVPQLCNMAVLYIAIHAINGRSRRASGKIWAACQVHAAAGSGVVPLVHHACCHLGALDCKGLQWRNCNARGSSITVSMQRAGLTWGGSSAAQEEVALSLVVSAAIMWLLLSLCEATAQDYAYACFFLICTTSLLKIRCTPARPCCCCTAAFVPPCP